MVNASPPSTAVAKTYGDPAILRVVGRNEQTPTLPELRPLRHGHLRQHGVNREAQVCAVPAMPCDLVAADMHLKNAGFTLVELLVVMALLAMLAGLTIPRFHKSLGRSQLRQAAQQLARDLATARLLAIDHGCTYVVRHEPIGPRYYVGPRHIGPPATSLGGSTSRDGSTPPAATRPDANNEQVTPEDSRGVHNVTPAPQDRFPRDRVRDEQFDAELPTGVVFSVANPTVLEPGSEPNIGPNPGPPTRSSPAPNRLWNDGIAVVPGQQVVDNSTWPESLVFYPDGRAESSTVTLQSDNGYRVHLTVRGLTGGVQVSPLERSAPLTMETETRSSPTPESPTLMVPNPKRDFAIRESSRWALAHGFRREPDANACRLVYRARFFPKSRNAV